MDRRLRQLIPAARAARRSEEAAAQALAEVHRRITGHRARIDQLRAFRVEYGEQLSGGRGDGLSGRRVQEYAAFLSNVDRSISSLEVRLHRLQGELAGRRSDWLAGRARAGALAQWIQRLRREGARLEELAEQAEADERSRHFGPRGRP